MGLTQAAWVYFDLVWDVNRCLYRLMDTENGAIFEQDGHVIYFLCQADAEAYLVAEDIRASIRNVLGGP